MAATATHSGSRALPAHRTTIGAMASRGTVWLATTHGIKPRSAKEERTNSRPKAETDETPGEEANQCLLER